MGAQPEDQSTRSSAASRVARRKSVSSTVSSRRESSTRSQTTTPTTAPISGNRTNAQSWAERVGVGVGEDRRAEAAGRVEAGAVDRVRDEEGEGVGQPDGEPGDLGVEHADRHDEHHEHEQRREQDLRRPSVAPSPLKPSRSQPLEPNVPRVNPSRPLAMPNTRAAPMIAPRT